MINTVSIYSLSGVCLLNASARCALLPEANPEKKGIIFYCSMAAVQMMPSFLNPCNGYYMLSLKNVSSLSNGMRSTLS